MKNKLEITDDKIEYENEKYYIVIRSNGDCTITGGIIDPQSITAGCDEDEHIHGEDE